MNQWEFIGNVGDIVRVLLGVKKYVDIKLIERNFFEHSTLFQICEVEYYGTAERNDTLPKIGFGNRDRIAWTQQIWLVILFIDDSIFLIEHKKNRSPHKMKWGVEGSSF